FVAPVENSGNPDRTAQRKAVIVPALTVLHQAASSVVGERSACVQRFVDEVFVSAPVVGIGARFHGDVEVSASDLAELSGEIAGFDCELLDGIHAGLSHRLRVDESVGGVLPFDTHGLRIAGQAVDANAGVGPPVGAGQEIQDRVGVPDTGPAGVGA